MNDVKKLLTIIDPVVMEEMKKHLPADLIVDKVATSDSSLIIGPFDIASSHKKPFYTTNRPNNYKEVFKAKGQGYLPKEVITTSFGAKFTKIIAECESVGSLSDLFGKETEALKISQYFQVGSLVDRLTESASENLNNYLSFHRSLYHLFQFLCYFANKEGFTPIECEKTVLGDGLCIQMSLKLDSEDVTLLRSILLKDANETKQSLTREFLLAVEDCDFTDITFIQKTNRIVVTMFFASKVKERLSGFRFSDNLALIPRISSEAVATYPVKSKDVRVLDNQFPKIDPEKFESNEDLVVKSNEASGDQETRLIKGSKEDLAEELTMVKGTREDLTEDRSMVKGSRDDQTLEAIKIKSSSDANENTKTVVKFNSESAKENFPPAKKFALFIRNYREREGQSAENYKLTDTEILDYLKFYPRAEVINTLSEEAKALICIMVRDTKVYDNVSRAIEDIGQSGFLEKVEEVQKVISSNKIEDIAEMISVQGGKKDFSEEVSKVKGWLEDQKEELIKISSNYEELDENEKWEVKKLHINNTLKEEVQKIKSSGVKVTPQEYSKILVENLGIKEEDSNYLVKGLVENAAGDMVVSRIDELKKTFERVEITKREESSNSASSESVKETQKTILVNNPKLEEQVLKMKKIMDGMKAEIIRLRSESVSKNSSDLSGPDFQLQLVKVELEKTKQELQNKDKVARKFKDDIDSIIKDKDKTINALKEKVEQNKIDASEGFEAELKKKNDELAVENRTLKTKLELANKKVQIMSDSMDKQDADFMLKKEREVEHLKTQITMSQSVIQKFKDEKTKLESEVFNLRDKLSSAQRDGKANESKDNNEHELQKRDIIIQSLTQEKKQAEDQYKLQSVELKKLEQKIKILTVQNDELSKKKGGSAKNVENAQRQVELANEKAKEAVLELTEKKKEILKLKNENSIQNVKIQELERKLASLERAKAS